MVLSCLMVVVVSWCYRDPRTPHPAPNPASMSNSGWLRLPRPGARRRPLIPTPNCRTPPSTLINPSVAFNQVGYAYPGLAPDAVRLLSPHGSLLALRHEMRYPFAVWLVQQAALAPVAGAGLHFRLGAWVYA